MTDKIVLNNMEKIREPKLRSYNFHKKVFLTIFHFSGKILVQKQKSDKKAGFGQA
jgi:hypothetical protein